MLTFEVSGRAVPYHRTTQRQKFVDKRYKKYLEYKQYVALLAKQAMKKQKFPIIPKRVPISFGCRVYLKGGMDGDLSNYIKGVEDALNKVVFADDRWIYHYHAADKIIVSSESEERVEIEIVEMEALDEAISKQAL
jgi:crossover junction endodeoxyribonuclease RusA